MKAGSRFASDIACRDVTTVVFSLDVCLHMSLTQVAYLSHSSACETDNAADAGQP